MAAELDRVRQRALLARAFLSEATKMVASRHGPWSAMSYVARARYQAESLALAARTFRDAEEAQSSTDLPEECAQLSLPIVTGCTPHVSL